MTNIHTYDLDLAFEELKGNAFKIFIYFYSKNDGWVFDNEVIARLMDLKERTVRELIKELETKGYIYQQRGKPGEISVYLVGKKPVEEYTSQQ